MHEVKPPADGLVAGGSGGRKQWYAGRLALRDTLDLGLALALVTTGLSVLVSFFKTRAAHYKITSQRIVIESGSFSQRLEQEKRRRGVRVLDMESV